MPGGGVEPAAQTLALQMMDFHPGRSPRPGSLDRHLASLSQRWALPHRDYCRDLNASRQHLKRRRWRSRHCLARHWAANADHHPRRGRRGAANAR